MSAPHPAGTRIVILDARLARMDVAAHEWNEPVLFVAPPVGSAATDARASVQSIDLPHAALRPWAPAHVRAVREASGDVAISWVRCARIGGDSWGPGEPPLGAPNEAYQIDILNGGGATLRSSTISTAGYTYTAAGQIADFGAPPTSLRLRVAQLDASGSPGLNNEVTISL
jgi:hypothetical protein